MTEDDDDDAIYEDDAFLSEIANVEARHAEHFAKGTSSEGQRISAQQTSGKRSVEWEEQDVYGNSDQVLGFGNFYSADDDTSKRRRTENISRPGNGEALDPGGQSDSQPEGEYMAALRGSNSEVWQSSTLGRGTGGLAIRGASGNVGAGGNIRSGGSGPCYKCGIEGHWAKDCTGAKAVGCPTKLIGREDQEAPDVPERLCACGAGMCLVLTANTEKNMGRNFYRCPLRKDEGQCTFFEWCDSAGQAISNDRGSPQPQLECKCGAGPCAVLTAKTEKNLGRQFYKCPLPQGQGCSFFQWCDEMGNDSGGSIASTPRYVGIGVSSTPASGTCYKCGLEGHWSRDCPNQQQQYGGGGNSLTVPRVTTGYSGNGSSSAAASGTCFKCGLEGHWSRDCPNQQQQCVGGGSTSVTPTKMANYVGNGTSSSPASGSCFKCGLEGHWSRDCPNQQSQYSSSFPGQTQSYSGRAATEGKNTGNCFKCGGQGHWSNSCPNAGGMLGSQNNLKPGSGGSSSGGKCYKCGEPGHWASQCPGWQR